MKNFFTLTITILILADLHAQPTFEKTIGSIDDDMGFSIKVCSDNSYILCGYTTDFYTGYEDIYIVKIDQEGDTVWAKREGDENYDEWGYSIYQTIDQGYIITGFMINEGSMIPYLLKLDHNGTKEWFKDYSEVISEGSGYSVIQTSDTNYAFCGTSDYYESENILWERKVFLVKTNNSGDVIWDKTFGNYGIHYGSGLTQANDNGFVISGLFDTPGEYHDAWLFKTNQNGNLNWNKTFGGSSSMESAWSVKKTLDGGYILCGTKFYGLIAMYGDIYVVKTDVNGNEVWSQTYGGDDDDRGSDVDVTNDGGFIFCGTTESYGAGNNDVWLVRTDSNGDTLWTRTYGGIYDDRAYSVCTTNDGGFIICGSTGSFGNGGDDLYIIKTNFIGTLTSVGEISNINNDIIIYPNPSAGMFQLECNYPVYEYEILDINGKVINSKTFKNNKSNISINISNRPDGIYYLKVKSGKEFQVLKLIKQ